MSNEQNPTEPEINVVQLGPDTNLEDLLQTLLSGGNLAPFTEQSYCVNGDKCEGKQSLIDNSNELLADSDPRMQLIGASGLIDAAEHDGPYLQDDALSKEEITLLRTAVDIAGISMGSLVRDDPTLALELGALMKPLAALFNKLQRLEKEEKPLVQPPM